EFVCINTLPDEAASFACQRHVLSITPHKRSAVWGLAASSIISVPEVRALKQQSFIQQPHNA
ncbi:MAG: hypothetical protein J6X62_03070, partial [Bacteroidales bacterium]|nr:hypothetical protein [Bacteroidales bacterium]